MIDAHPYYWKKMKKIKDERENGCIDRMMEQYDTQQYRPLSFLIALFFFFLFNAGHQLQFY
jgi:hypothetical protein